MDIIYFYELFINKYVYINGAVTLPNEQLVFNEVIFTQYGSILSSRHFLRGHFFIITRGWGGQAMVFRWWSEANLCPGFSPSTSTQVSRFGTQTKLGIQNWTTSTFTHGAISRVPSSRYFKYRDFVFYLRPILRLKTTGFSEVITISEGQALPCHLGNR